MKDLLAKKGVKHLMSFIGDRLPQLAFVMLVLFKEFSFLVLIRFVLCEDVLSFLLCLLNKMIWSVSGKKKKIDL